jgi:tRNA(fMet)-specific endonuclease VapC
MQLYMLDTDTCSYAIKERTPAIRERLSNIALEEQCISVVTYAELLYGVKRSSSKRINRPIVEAFVKHLAILSWDADAAEHYGDMRAALEKNGTPIGNMDMMIAAHARSLGAIVITNNVRHFKRVPGLRVEAWG